MACFHVVSVEYEVYTVESEVNTVNQKPRFWPCTWYKTIDKVAKYTSK